MAQHSDLRHNAKGNLFWCASAEVKANRGTYTQQFFGGNPLFVQEFEDGPDAALAADHTDICGRRVDDDAQPLYIVRMSASDKDNVGTWGDGIFAQRLFDITHQQTFRIREAFAAGKRRAIWRR